VYALPPLLTTDSNVLTISTIVGDALQFIALFILWVAVARVYLPRLRWARILVVIADAMVVLVGIAITAQVNLANPVTLTYVNGAWSINYVVSMGYQVVSAITPVCYSSRHAFGANRCNSRTVLKKYGCAHLQSAFLQSVEYTYQDHFSVQAP
jgi:hypothetical protein